jgi:hypothetical protein
VSFCGPTDPLDEPEDPELPLLLPLLPPLPPLLPPLDEPEEASTTSRLSSSDRLHEELAAIAPAIARPERARMVRAMDRFYFVRVLAVGPPGRWLDPLPS